eukprot:s1052_g2.t1
MHDLCREVALAPHVVALCTLFVTTWQLLRRSKRATCPSVPGSWLLGTGDREMGVWNLPGFLCAALSHRHLDMFVEHHRELGKTILYKFPFKPEIISTTSPRTTASNAMTLARICAEIWMVCKNIEHMLKGNFSNFVKGWWFRAPLTQLLGDGIFNADGPFYKPVNWCPPWR